MLFSRDKDDDDDFFPNPNYHSNLASIFGGAGGGGENNSSLTYTPPKQPRRQHKPTTIAAPATSATRSSSLLLCVKTVQTFKMVDGAYQKIGKLGAAILRFSTEEGDSFQILLYRDKNNHLCNSRIVREFKFHIQPKNYCTFYDKQNIIWSILFDSPADMAEFNLQVAKCRWKAEQSTSPILIQDLWCPLPNGEVSKSSAAAGDSVELTYTLSTIDNSSEEVGDSQRVVVEVEASGWKQALVGVQLNTQRVIILQPFMLGDLNPNEVVFNSPVVVKFTVLQVNKVSQPEPPANLPPEEIQGSQVKEISKHEPALPDISDQKTSESPRSPKSTKADLINRMARMGQALPFKKTVPTPSDSDETESCSQEDRKSPMQRLSKAVPKPRARAQHGSQPAGALEGVGAGAGVVEPAPLPPPVAITPQVPVQWAAGIQPYMVGNMYPVAQVGSPLESHSQFNMFLSEVRTTNSELRMGLTRLTDKVETLQSKVEDSKKTPPSQDINSVLEKLMEGEKQLKDQLQQVLTTLQNTQLASLNRASVEPATQPSVQPLVQPPVQPIPAAVHPPSAETCPQCAELRQAHVLLSDQMKKLQEENELLQISLTAQKDALFNAKIADKDQLSQIETLQKQLSEEQRSVSELNSNLESLERVKEKLADDLQTANNTISELQNTVQEKQTSIDRLEQSLKDSDATKLEEVRRNLQEVLDPKPIVGEHVKKILNNVYRLVKAQFEPQTQYDSIYIQSVLADTIKAVTFEYLQNGELISSDKATPAVADQSMYGTSSQVKSEGLKTQQATSDVDAKSSVISVTTGHSSESSLTSQSNITSENKVVEIHHTEENLKGLNGENHPIENKTPVDPTSSIFNGADNSSDDGYRPQPPPPPLFEDEEIDDDWMNS